MALATMFGVVALTAISFLIAGNAGDDSAIVTDAINGTGDATGSSDTVAGLTIENGTADNTTTQAVTIDPTAPQTITGTVDSAAGLPVEGTTAELYMRGNNDGRAAFVYSVATDANGFYAISAPVGCYVLVISPPPGQTMADGTASYEEAVCVDATIVRLTIDAQTSG